MSEVPCPTVGRVVFFTLAAGLNKGKARPATVVDVIDSESRCVEITISLASGDSLAGPEDRIDGAMVRDSAGHPTFLRVLATHGESGQLGTWHWPLRAP